MEAIILTHTYLSWIFPAFLLIFGLIAFLKVWYPKHFAEYQKLIFNDKYIVIYGKKEHKIWLFSILLYLIQCISLALYAYIAMKYYGISSFLSVKYMFLEVVLVVIGVLLLKLLLQQWISSIFELSEFANDYIFNRVAYTSYGAIVMIIFLFIGVYTFKLTEAYLFILLLMLLSVNVLSWFKIVKDNQKEIKPYIFYFILYLCALEIAPYLFLVYGTRYLVGV